MTRKLPMPAGPERDALFRKLYITEGLSQSKIAEMLGFSRERARQLIFELRIKPRIKLKRPQRLAMIPKMINQGMTAKAMADTLGFSAQVLHQDIAILKPTMSKKLWAKFRENHADILRRLNTGKRHPSFEKAIDKRRPQILGLIDKGWSLGRIGAKFDVTGQTIRNDLKTINISKKVQDQIQANRVAESRKTRAKGKA